MSGRKILFFISFVILTIAISSCDSNKKTGSLHSVFEQYYEDKLRLNPLEATSIGDARYNDLLPVTISQSYKSALKGFYSKYLNLLKRHDRSILNENDKLSYDILKWECSIQLEELSFHTELMPINQFESIPLFIAQMAGGTGVQPFKTVKDYDNWLGRLNAFCTWCDTAILNLSQGMKAGYVLPEALADKVIIQFHSLDHGPVQEHLFYRPVNMMPADFPESDKKRIKDAYLEIINNKIIPVFSRFHDFFQNEYLQACRKTAGVYDIPNGKAYYEHLVKYFTTTDLTPDEIFDIGNREIARISGEMEKVKTEVGYKGDLKSFFNFVRENKALMPYKNADEVLQHFKTIHETIKPKLKILFDLVPKTGFEVRRTEAFREKTASAEYIEGTWDGTRPGIFYVPIPEVSKYNIFADEDLFLHEAIPGHHYQVSLQQEDTLLPKFRRSIDFCAYTEGWGLYSESLGKELGLYTDPYQYFGMLSMEMHRSIRLVVDVGIHYKKWTREQAIQFSLEHEAKPEQSIIAEVERYMAYPGQALSYKIGQLKILELRAKAEEKLGDKFNIREFHNKILDSGCLPLMVLEEKINHWIESVK